MLVPTLTTDLLQARLWWYRQGTEDKAAHFTADYQRVAVPGGGHFVPREAPGTVAELVAELLVEHLAAR